MKAASLHHGIQRAVQRIGQSSPQCIQCGRGSVASKRFSLPIRTFTSSCLRRAEDDPSRTTDDEARLADATSGVKNPSGPEQLFKAAPEIDLGRHELQNDEGLNVAQMEQTQTMPQTRSAETLPSMRQRLNPQSSPAPRKSQRYASAASARDLSRLRVVPASPSYFTSQPNFTDHYLAISALYRKHQLLPLGSHTETRIKWLSLAEYKAMVGDEPVAAKRYRQLIDMCQKLSYINKHLMPEEVTTAIATFMKEEQPRVKHIKAHTVDEHGRAYGLGRRKAATARAWIVRAREGQSAVMVNGKSLTQYFSRLTQRESAIYPLTVTERVGNYNVWAVAEGGGNTGQAEALTLAIAKALCVYEPQLKNRLGAAGCLTRDRRRVERKKPGHLKARKKPAWVKR